MLESQQKQAWHTLTVEETEKALNTTEEGLSDAEAAKRLAAYGPNNLRQKKAKSVWRMIWEQLTDVMVLILIAAAIFSFIMSFFEDGEGLAECIVILVVVILNATVGVVQEKKAANALESLKNMTAPTARVLREGEESVVPASELVPGDIVYLEDGCIVPADIRIIQDSNMKVQEAALTGESVPSEKDGPTVLPEDAPLGDRVNMAYSSSVVMYGNATGIVVGTGMNTEVGKIAGLLDEQDETDTPMKRKLNAVGKTLSLVGLIVCVLIFAIGLIRDAADWVNYIFIAISLAISIIPEGLPATSTIIMALGVQRMAQKNALVKSLPAVETLGSATVVCCDKTGTLTLNKMTVTHVAVGDDFERGAATPVADLSQKYDSDIYRDLLEGSALCVNAKMDPDHPGNVLGDPTEGALLLFAEQFGIDAEEFEDANPRKFEQPFDSDRKRMTVLNRTERGLISYTKGAVDEMLPLCTKLRTKEGVRDMTDADRDRILQLCYKMSGEALRVLGFAVCEQSEVPEDESADLEKDMTFVGAVGMIDPPRKEVIQAVETCHTAGIRVVMITGDHKVTAMAIAKQLHIFREGNTIISGPELDDMTDEQLDKAVKNCVVFARVSPSDKLRIIQSLKRTGEVAAMTGDGVNDSPALKEADIGVAMGITGTDVAKDAADVILLDDNFTTIEYAIREGRRVYRNIQKVIQFLVAGNIAEILIQFIAVCIGLPEMPIEAVHILLINLATDSLPAVALGVDPASPNVMKHKPVKSGTLFEKGMIYRIIVHGLFISAAAWAAYLIGTYCFAHDHVQAMTMTFIVLSVSQLSHALNQRSNTESVFKPGQGHNKFLALALLVSAAIVALVVFVPPLQSFFNLTNLTWQEWLVSLALSLFPLVAVEISKIFIRIYQRRHGTVA